jgi:hypothetical protein
VAPTAGCNRARQKQGYKNKAEIDAKNLSAFGQNDAEEEISETTMKRRQ